MLGHNLIRTSIMIFGREAADNVYALREMVTVRLNRRLTDCPRSTNLLLSDEEESVHTSV